MKISVITVCYNSAATIADTFASVAAQSHPDVEHIVIDGGSTDGTVDIIKRHQPQIAHWISEKDRGLYDAMNKGLQKANGDVVGFLNADDVYSHSKVLTSVAHTLAQSNLDACYADLAFVAKGRVVRQYSSKRFRPSLLAYGWMPAHPTFYARRKVYQQWGGFATDYVIAADYELMCRLFNKAKIRYQYVSESWVHMQPGGLSTKSWRSNLLLNQEIVRACRANGIRTHLAKVLLKYPLKLAELKWLRS